MKQNQSKKDLIFKCKTYGITIFLVIAASITFYFLIDKPNNILGFVSDVFSILSPIITGLIFAFLLNPLMVFYQKYLDKLLSKKSKNPDLSLKFSKYTSISLALLTGILTVTVLIILIIPNLIKSITQLSADLPEKIQTWIVWLDNIIPNNLIDLAQTKITDYLSTWFSEDFFGTVDIAAGYFATGMVSIYNFIFDVLIGLIVSFYILSGKEYFKRILNKILCVFFKKETILNIITIVKDSNRLFANFIVGKLLGAVIMGIMCFIGMTIFKMPYPLLISSIIGVTNVIPYFGPFIGTIPTAFLIFLDTPLTAVYFVIMILVLQQIDCNLIEPRILKESLGISSFWIIFSIMLFGGLYGLAGMLFGAPVFAVIYNIISRFLKKRLERKGLPTNDEAYLDISNIYTEEE